MAYQLTLPTYFDGAGAGWTTWWTARQHQLGIDPANGLSASLVSLAVAAVATLLLGAPALLRRRHPAPDSESGAEREAEPAPERDSEPAVGG